VAPLPGETARGSVSSGHPALDAILGTAGWPRGSLAALDAPLGSGATSLALDSVAACQAGGGLAAWLDLEQALDPALAARRGVRPEWLLIVHPNDPAEAVDLAAWLARTRLLDLIVLDLGDRTGIRGLERLATLLARTGGLALLLGSEAATRAAGVRVQLDRQAWLAVGTDLIGQRVEATVTRQRHAAIGASTELDLWFSEGRRTDPLLAGRAEPRPVAEPLAFQLPRSQALSA
jgi:hypothetical protein